MSENQLNIIRYPKTNNRSLQAWNAADEYILSYIDENKLGEKSAIIYGDRFGYLTLNLNELKPEIIIEYKSQYKALKQNCILNGIDLDVECFSNPLEKQNKQFELAIVKIPKSLDLFRLYLYQISKAITDDAVVICGFMTRHFTPQILETAKLYFESVEQSLAWKKSRLLILKGKKAVKGFQLINKVAIDDNKYLEQYFGVFSANNIDYATQFLLNNLELKETDQKILDLASGNGIIAHHINNKLQESEIHLIDDSYLAVESSKLNLKREGIHFHYNDNLENFENNYFDLVVSNPPFHFEHENNIEIALSLFAEVKQKLKTSGRFILVANKHLNYKTHLVKLFDKVKTIAENDRFVVYECYKEKP